MANKKTTTQDKKLEREYVIPLRKKYQHVARYKKTPKAIKTVKEFLARHMNVRDRDLKKIKLDKFLNETLWMNGIKNPPHKIKVKAIKEGEIVRVSASELPGKLEFKKKRLDKQEKEAKQVAEKKKSKMEEMKQAQTSKKPKEEKAKEDKEKEKENKDSAQSTDNLRAARHTSKDLNSEVKEKKLKEEEKDKSPKENKSKEENK
jgi:large subunit ribosomal protein L31e